MRKIILMLALVLTYGSAGAEDSVTFKGVPWGINQKQLMAKSTFKDVTCIKDKRERRLVSCYGDTTYVGGEASASISFLDNKLSAIELALDADAHSLYRYKEIREVLTAKYGLPKECDDPAKPEKSTSLGFNHEYLRCYWIGSDSLTGIRMDSAKLSKAANTKSKKKPYYSLTVVYGLKAEGETMFKLGQEAVAKEYLKRYNDL